MARGTNPEDEEGERTLARIEAALLAALGDGGGSDGGRALEALRADGLGPHVEAWLESVASELETSASVMVPDDMVEGIVRQIARDRRGSIRAHAKLDGRALRSLFRKI